MVLIKSFVFASVCVCAFRFKMGQRTQMQCRVFDFILSENITGDMDIKSVRFFVFCSEKYHIRVNAANALFLFFYFFSRGRYKHRSIKFYMKSMKKELEPRNKKCSWKM